jgi:ADP-heptose:LPS heptosyltransferase/predicted SAM-dependent methyltransferase
MVWSLDGKQGNEAAKIRWELVPFTGGNVLDLGCGPFKAFPHFIGVDNGHHDAQFGWQNKANVVVDTCEKLSLFASSSMDAVFSSHLLEHIEHPERALREWWRVIRCGGYLCLYLPHKNFYPNIGQRGANPDHKHDFLPTDIITMMESLGGWDLVRNEDRNGGDEYSFFQVYKKRSDKQQNITPPVEHEKTCGIVRYGAFGDLLMASSIFPWLKAQGYHITLYTTPNGYEIAQSDPHIDHFYLQGRDQVPNGELGDFWNHERAKYDRWINLSESIEGTLLPIPGRIAHQWPDSVRRVELNKNYLEWTHQLAEVPLPVRQKFYPTAEEKAWARKERAAMGDAPVVLWSLSGSSMHKTWPWLDQAIAQLLLSRPRLKIVLVGDDVCQILEQGWEAEPRVLRRSGRWSIRQSMAFCDYANVVVGCETGLLNCAGLLDVPKVIVLSHSSQENLTKHWKNTIALEPPTPCHPCHRMHYGFDFCFQHEESGVAQCQADVSAADMVAAIKQSLDQIRTREVA